MSPECDCRRNWIKVPSAAPITPCAHASTALGLEGAFIPSRAILACAPDFDAVSVQVHNTSLRVKYTQPVTEVLFAYFISIPVTKQDLKLDSKLHGFAGIQRLAHADLFDGVRAE